MNAEETKRWKAKQLRYKKPIVRDLNLDKIQEDLWNIMEECENIRWYTDSDDGNDSLINALDGDEDEAYEFKMAFADLCAECERMQEDLREEWIPNCFDIFFVAAGAGESFGGLLGWDSFEGDYFGINSSDAWAEDEAKKKLKSFTNRQLNIRDYMQSTVRSGRNLSVIQMRFHRKLGFNNADKNLIQL